MRIETNDFLIKRNRRIATTLFFFSLAVLIFGFFAANGQFLGFDVFATFGDVGYLLVMPVVLLIGFTATVISVRMTNLWIRQPRPEEAIVQGLKGIGSKAVLYNYLHLPARHVLIAPQGVFAIVTRFQDGHFIIKNDRWKQKRSLFGMIFSVFRMDGIGDPRFDAELAADHIQDIIDEINSDVEVQPIIVVVDPRAVVEIEGETSVPIVYALQKTGDKKLSPNLKEYLREVAKEERATLTQEEITAFEEATIFWEEAED